MTRFSQLTDEHGSKDDPLPRIVRSRSATYCARNVIPGLLEPARFTRGSCGERRFAPTDDLSVVGNVVKRDDPAATAAWTVKFDPAYPKAIGFSTLPAETARGGSEGATSPGTCCTRRMQA